MIHTIKHDGYEFTAEIGQDGDDLFACIHSVSGIDTDIKEMGQIMQRNASDWESSILEELISLEGEIQDENRIDAYLDRICEDCE
jgi:hypothetical protein